MNKKNHKQEKTPKKQKTAAPIEEERFPLVCYANRELSWLQFNARVLEESTDENNPLCEKLSFAAIFQSNLDEFFMVRVGGLCDQLSMNDRENKTGMTAKEQLDAVLTDVRTLTAKKDQIYTDLMSRMKALGTEILTFDALNEKQKRLLEQYFISDVQPLLSPQIVAPKQTFPFLNGKDIYAIVTLHTKSGSERLGIVPCTNRVLRRLVPVPSKKDKYILMEDLILHFAPRIFDRYRIVSKSLVRILRNADISVDNDLDENGSHDYRRKMEKMIRTRQKLCPVKMDYRGAMDDKAVSSLCKRLNLSKKQVFASAAPLDLSFLFQLQDNLHDRRELFYPRRLPQRSPSVDPQRPMIDQILEKDLLLAYPYESIQPFLRLLQEAGHDPDVVSIKMTLYRVAKNSRVVDALCQAAENGKDVTVLVELRARFDEENNIGWSRTLEDAGCHIIYGIGGIKVHSKLCLITRKSGDEIQYISQYGTGNYNEKTSRQYTDLSLMTSNADLGRESAKVFQCLCMGEVVENMDHLLVAPHCLKNQLIAFIDEEIAKVQAGKSGYVGVKCNSLEDKDLIDKLIEASQAGVKVDLCIRGICCMVSGIPGLTDNIRIVSIVGRYLEHARIYLFGTGEDQKVYISSADFMKRNTSRRVEVAAPIYDEALKARIVEMFRIMLADNVKVRVQQSDGTFQKRVAGTAEPLNAQEYFFEQAYLAAGTALTDAKPVEEPVSEASAPQPQPVAEPKQEAPVKEPTRQERKNARKQRRPRHMLDLFSFLRRK